MKNRKMLLQVLVAMALVLSLIAPASALNMNSVMAQEEVTPMVAAGGAHTVGLKSDGTVVAVGDNDNGQCDVNGWAHITQVAAGYYHTVGLKSDGTVVAVGENYPGQCEVGGWKDIVQVAAGGAHTVGLKSDGTVVAVGDNDDGQCDVGGWTDIVQVSALWYHTVGLKSDGTVVAVGSNGSGQCDVGNWTDIVQVSAGGYHTVGLKSDGTVVAVGYNGDGQCDVGGWTDIVQVAAGGVHTVGLEAHDTVVATTIPRWWEDSGQCNVGGWGNITQVAAGGYHTVGLKSDGTVVAVGDNDDGQLYVSGWNLVLAVPPSECLLTISSLGGSVITPGEGAFTYGPGMVVVDLVAEPDEGHRFVHWTGDVDSIMDVGKASTTIIMDNDHAIRANFAPVEVTELRVWVSPSTGPPGTEVWVKVTNPERIPGSYESVETVVYFNGAVIFEHDYEVSATELIFVYWIPKIWPGEYTFKVLHTAFNISGTATFTVLPGTRPSGGGIIAGDWIEYKCAVPPAGHTGPEWLRLEFLSIEGSTANVRAMLRMSDGTEQSKTLSVNPSEGGGEAFGLAGFLIPPNMGIGDSVYITGYGDVTIEGETTRTYAGARRDVVYARLSQPVPYQGEVQLTYYWDKETGVMVEGSVILGDTPITNKVIETNMWEASTVLKLWWLWVILGTVVAGVVFFFVRRRARKGRDLV